MRMKCRAPSAPVMNHLWPWMRHRSTSLVAVVRIIEGSEPAPGCGSVMTKAERASPSMIGCSQRAFWSSFATLSSTIMLPSSGAALLNASGPKIDRFISS